MEKIFVSSCNECPFYDDNNNEGNDPYCVISMGLFLDRDVTTDRIKIPNNCPLKQGPIAIYANEEN